MASRARPAIIDWVGKRPEPTFADSWRQATGAPVWGTPYGPYSEETGQPAGEDAIRTALAAATR